MTSRAVNGFPMKLVTRVNAGVDDRGQPVMDDEWVDFQGYFWQWGTEDSDRSGEVSLETGKVIMFLDRTISPEGWYAIEFQSEGTLKKFEIIGKPEPKHSLARGNTLHHWEVLVQRAAA